MAKKTAENVKGKLDHVGKYNKPLTIDKPLTMKEQKFVEEYLISGNGKQSVLKAGYKIAENSAPEYANRLLHKINVAHQIGLRLEERQKESIATAQDVMEYFSKVMRGEIKDQFGLDAPLSERTKAASELAKRTIDIENRLAGKEDATVVIKLDWGRGGKE